MAAARRGIIRIANGHWHAFCTYSGIKVRIWSRRHGQSSNSEADAAAAATFFTKTARRTLGAEPQTVDGEAVDAAAAALVAGASVVSSTCGAAK